MTRNLPLPLSAKYKDSFAYLTIKDRLPDILTRALDSFHREWKTHLTDVKEVESVDSEVKAAIGELSKLRYLMMTNKPLEYLEYEDAPDFKHWVEAIKEEKKTLGDNNLTWFNGRWLFVECYLYRKIADIFLVNCKKFHSYDPFETQKKNSLINNIPSAEVLACFLSNSSSDSSTSNLQEWLELSLWGNRCDLSLKSTTPSFDNIVEHLSSLRKNLIVNNTSLVLQRFEGIKESPHEVILDFVLDNAGFELFTDLCLMHYLTESLTSLGKLKKIRIHVKSYPWFVSDVMRKDFLWTLDYLSSQTDTLRKLSSQWKKWTDGGVWQIIDSYFWTMPSDFDLMKKVDPCLYIMLQQSSLIVFKGDLNYRKLLGDLNWPHNTSFERAVRSFRPAFFVSLRTNKADLIVGIQDTSIEKEIPEDFLVSGEYAVIQALSPLSNQDKNDTVS